MKTAEEIRSNLPQFTGTEGYHQCFPPSMKCTDGVHYLRESADCFWLIDAISSYQPKVAGLWGGGWKDELQVWEFIPRGGKSKKWDLFMWDGDDREKRLIRQEFHFTDFSLEEGIKFYVRSGVIMLTSEY